jgi:hypothetical protein
MKNLFEKALTRGGWMDKLPLLFGTRGVRRAKKNCKKFAIAC